MKRLFCLLAAGCVVILAAAFAATALAEDIGKITPLELNAMLGRPDVVVVDVRIARDWKSRDAKIKGAVREDPREVGRWTNTYPEDKTLVFYCA